MFNIFCFLCFCPSVMASSWISAARLWRVSLCSIFPACTGAPTCGASPRKDGITIAWVRKCQREWLAALSLMPRSSSFVCKVSQTLGRKPLNKPGLLLKCLYNQISIYSREMITASFLNSAVATGVVVQLLFHCSTFKCWWRKLTETSDFLPLLIKFKLLAVFGRSAHHVELFHMHLWLTAAVELLTHR